MNLIFIDLDNRHIYKVGSERNIIFVDYDIRHVVSNNCQLDYKKKLVKS